MEAILEATARDTFGKNEARRTRRDGTVPAVLYGATSDGASREATPIAVDPKALLQDPALRVGRQHADLAEAGRRGRRARAGQGVSARSGHARSCCTPTSTASRWTSVLQVTMPVVVKGEPKGVKQQGGILEFIRREIEVECLPADIPEHVEVDVSELMLHQGVRVRDIATNPKWKPVSDPDMMLVHVDHAEGRGSRGAGRSGGRGDGDAGRARSHQEGQEGRGRGKRKTTRRSSADSRRSVMKLIVGLGNPGREVSRHAAQRRVRGRRRAGAARGASSSSRRRSTR